MFFGGCSCSHCEYPRNILCSNQIYFNCIYPGILYDVMFCSNRNYRVMNILHPTFLWVKKIRSLILQLHKQLRNHRNITFYVLSFLIKYYFTFFILYSQISLFQQPVKLTSTFCANVPCNYYYKIHDVPCISEVTSTM